MWVMAARKRKWSHDPVPLDTFGFRLAGMRAYIGGWNVKRAAAEAGIDDSTWRNWEAGRTRPQNYEEVCRQIADTFGVDSRWLAGGGPVRNRCFSLPSALSA